MKKVKKRSFKFKMVHLKNFLIQWKLNFCFLFFHLKCKSSRTICELKFSTITNWKLNCFFSWKILDEMTIHIRKIFSYPHNTKNDAAFWLAWENSFLKRSYYIQSSWSYSESWLTFLKSSLAVKFNFCIDRKQCDIKLSRTFQSPT